MKFYLIIGLLSLWVEFGRAETFFLEAEHFKPSSDGWKIAENPQTRGASLAEALNGASGDPSGKAVSKIIDAGFPKSSEYRVWVRYGYHSRFRGGFKVAALHGPRVLAEKVFDVEKKPGVKDWTYVWDYFDVKTIDFFRLELSKHNNKNLH